LAGRAAICHENGTPGLLNRPNGDRIRSRQNIPASGLAQTGVTSIPPLRQVSPEVHSASLWQSCGPLQHGGALQSALEGRASLGFAKQHSSPALQSEVRVQLRGMPRPTVVQDNRSEHAMVVPVDR
jgi:hypothetical protein